MNDHIGEAFVFCLVVIAIVVVVLAWGHGGVTCPSGYFSSVREYACIPGYRP